MLNLKKAQEKIQKTELSKRTNWTRKRFGDVPEKCLGNMQDLKPVIFPDITESISIQDRENNNHDVVFRLITNIDEEANRVAEIYQNAIDEIIGNSDYEWLHSPEEIIKNVKTGEYAIYGYYADGKLSGVGSFHKEDGQRRMQWVWGAIDPQTRGIGMWQHIGAYQDKVVEASGAQIGFVWVATTHPFSQKQLEAVGYHPWGMFPGGEFFGGSDGQYYRSTVIWYGKIYGETAKNILPRENLKLTEHSEQIADAVFSIWENSPEKKPKLT